jgi:hypothetical protein
VFSSLSGLLKKNGLNLEETVRSLEEHTKSVPCFVSSFSRLLSFLSFAFLSLFPLSLLLLLILGLLFLLLSLFSLCFSAVRLFCFQRKSQAQKVARSESPLNKRDKKAKDKDAKSKERQDRKAKRCRDHPKFEEYAEQMKALAVAGYTDLCLVCLFLFLLPCLSLRSRSPVSLFCFCSLSFFPLVCVAELPQASPR